jgi:hypothetical protein
MIRTIAFWSSASMHTPSATKIRLPNGRGRLVRAMRAGVHAVTLLCALLGAGIVPAGVVAGSNEAESQQEGPSSQYAEVRFESRAARRPSHRAEACLLSAPSPMTAGRLASPSSCLCLLSTRLSLGLAVPLRC